MALQQEKCACRLTCAQEEKVMLLLIQNYPSPTDVFNLHKLLLIEISNFHLFDGVKV